MIRNAWAGLVFAAACAIGAPATAADFSSADATYPATEAVPPGGGWEFQVTPYGWFTGINGTITAKGRSVSTSASFVDLVQNSDELIPFMGYLEAGKGRVSVFGDFFYSKLGFSAEKSKQVNPIAGLELSAKAKAALTTTLTIAQAALAYDVIKQQGTSVAFYGGIRYWDVTAEIDFDVKASVNLSNLGLKRKGNLAVAKSGDISWVDPVVGMRVRQEITPRDEISLLADIGGFGIGSEFSWQIFGGYTHLWDIGRETQLALSLGYRILSVDYEEGSGADARALDLTLHGPLAGLSVRF
jgi:hypothetical protein